MNDAYERVHEPHPVVEELRRQVETLLGRNDALQRALTGAEREPMRPAFRPGTLARAIPGWLSQFTGEVPATHRDENGVRCGCGHVPVAVGELIGCDCGRYFLHLGERILVARPEPEPAGA